MLRFIGATSVLVALLPLALPAQQPSSPPEIMRSEDLRPGMKGYGLTVFRGTEPERFDVEILGVIKHNFADGDMIIVRLEHEQLLQIGGVAGMSGSPIYVEDKLVGAFAYGWGFSVRPIGGVTPIEGMLRVLDTVTREPQVDPRESALSLGSWPEAHSAFEAAGRRTLDVTIPQVDLARLGILENADPSGTVTMTPLAVPLQSRSRVGYEFRAELKTV